MRANADGAAQRGPLWGNAKLLWEQGILGVLMRPCHGTKFFWAV